MFELILHIKAKQPSDPKQIQQIRRHLSEMNKLFAKEPGYISWQAFFDTEGQSDFFIHESWQTKTHWQQHLGYSAFVTHYENGILSLIDRDVYFVEPIG